MRYGITSLPKEVAGPRRLMEIAREEWGIENSLHWVRDVTFNLSGLNSPLLAAGKFIENHCQVRRGGAPEVLASLNNIVISILRLGGVSKVAKGQREWGWAFSRALLTKFNQP